MSRLKIGVIGAGAWGRNHVRTVAGLADGELAAVCDTSDATRQKLSRQYPSAVITADVDALLKVCEAVVIAAPAKAHADLALRAIEAGKPCLVEKPFALSVADAQRVAEAAVARKVPVLAGHLLAVPESR